MTDYFSEGDFLEVSQFFSSTTDSSSSSHSSSSSSSSTSSYSSSSSSSSSTPPSPSSGPIPELIQYCQAHHIQATKQNDPNDKEEVVALKKQHNELKQYLLGLLQSQSTTCFPTSMKDKNDKPLFLRIKNNRQLIAPNEERVRQLLDLLNSTIIKETMTKLLKKQAKKSGTTSSTTTKGRKRKSTTSACTITKKQKLTESETIPEVSHEPSSSSESIRFMDVLFESLKTLARSQLIKISPTVSMSATKPRNFKVLSPESLKNKSDEEKEVYAKIEQFVSVGKTLSAKYASMNTVTHTVNKIKTTIEPKVKEFLEKEYGEKKSCDILFGNQKYRVKCVERVKSKPLTITLVDKVFESALPQVVDPQLTLSKVQDIDTIWSDEFKAKLQDTFLQSFLSTLSSMKTKTESVTIRPIQPRKSNSSTQKDGEKEGEEEDEAEEEEEEDNEEEEEDNEGDDNEEEED